VPVSGLSIGLAGVFIRTVSQPGFSLCPICFLLFLFIAADLLVDIMHTKLYVMVYFPENPTCSKCLPCAKFCSRSSKARSLSHGASAIKRGQTGHKNTCNKLEGSRDRIRELESD
jgi:hypothetical protein